MLAKRMLPVRCRKQTMSILKMNLLSDMKKSDTQSDTLCKPNAPKSSVKSLLTFV